MLLTRFSRLSPHLQRLRKALLRLLAAFVALAVGTVAFFALLSHRRESHSAADAAPASGRFIPAGDVRIFVQEAGPPTGKAVVLVHGTGAWSEIWRDTMQALAAAGYRAIAIDVPPFGYSDKPRGVLAYAREKQARRILAVFAALRLQQVALVGHSVGARPATEAALREPGRIERLILVDPALGLQPTSAGAPRFAQNDAAWPVRAFFTARPLRNAVLATYGTNPLSTARLFRSFVAVKDAVTSARVQMLQRPLVVEGTTNGYGDWLQYLVAARDTSLGSDLTRFAHLRMPLFLIWGDRDTVTPLWQGEALRTLVPGSELVVLPGVGHIPYVEDPRRFNDALLRALANRFALEPLPPRR